MASLRQAASAVKEEALDGILWFALWKTGRSWHSDVVIGMEDFSYEDKILQVTADEAESLREIVAADSSAVLLNGYYYNLGICCDEERGYCNGFQGFVDALRWQYEGCQPLVSDWTVVVEEERG